MRAIVSRTSHIISSRAASFQRRLCSSVNSISRSRTLPAVRAGNRVSTTSQTRLLQSRIQGRGLRSQRRQYSSSQQPPNPTAQVKDVKEKTGLQAKLKELFKKYGYVSVGVYLALSAADFPFCFLAVRMAGPERIGQIEHQILSSLKGVTEPVWEVIKPVAGPVVDAVGGVVTRIKNGAVQTVSGNESSDTVEHAVGQAVTKHESASIWTQLALAYGIHKTLLIFIRVPLTAALTPRVARTLQSWGYKVGSKAS